MKSLISTHSKFDSSNCNDKVNVVIKRPALERNKLTEIALVDDVTLPNELLRLVQFTVETDGYYNCNLQASIKNVATKSVSVDCIQFGVCNSDLSDFEKAFNSRQICAQCAPSTIITDNLTTVKYLQCELTYCCWLNVASNKNESFQFLKPYSHLYIIKISD